jgi:Uncharacterized protein conserved in bacteria
MAKEIERKFLVINDRWRKVADAGVLCVQGYFTSNSQCSIRVRIIGNQANLNIKSATLGIIRTEYEYEIPLADAREMLRHFCTKPLIEKTRYHVRYDRHTWEIDVFSGANAGLMVAELELAHCDEPFTRPAWTGDEVTADPRYYNVCLVEHPYRDWG